MPERLQKLIARAGLTSRRTAEKLILSGRVRVNGHVIRTLGTKADPEVDRIEVDGKALRFPQAHLYLMLNKPRGYVTTAADPKGRRTVYALLKAVRQRVVPVGRLPYDAEGLLLLTSDGEFADTILRSRLPQTLWLKVKGTLAEAEQAKLVRAATQHGETSFLWKRVKAGANPWYETRLAGPRDDWLRNQLFRLGHPVEKLKRVALSSLFISDLPVGAFRSLTDAEQRRLLQEARAARKAMAE